MPPCYAPRATLATMTLDEPSPVDPGLELMRLQAARTALGAMQSRIEAGEPWPLAAVFGTEPEAAWGPREVLAHLAEMLPFWLGELERVVDGATPPVPFGRVADDAARIGIIERDRTLPFRVLFARVDRGLHDWAERLPTLTAEQRAARGLHPRRGEMTTVDIMELFVIGHTEEHLEQLESVVSNATG
jgi:DinB superfamily